MRSATARTGRRVCGATCVVVALTVSLAGCGVSVSSGEDLLDTEKLQSDIQTQVTDIIPGSTVSVTCPSEVQVQEGVTFDCTALINGQEATIKVTQTNDQGDVVYESESAVVGLDKVQTDISNDLSTNLGGTWQTECLAEGASGGVYVAPLGSTFICEVTGTTADGEQQSGDVEATVVDIGGGVQWRLLE